MRELNPTDFSGTDLILSEQQPDTLFLVKFTAKWCGPCRSYDPILAAVQTEHPEVQFCKCDIEECEEASQLCGILSVPAVFFYRAGKILERVPGVLPINLLNDFIKKHLEAKA